MPAIVEALAHASGQRCFKYQVIAAGGVSLIEYWNGGEARRMIAHGGWDVVVLQQGPSSTPENRALLIDGTRRFAREIRTAGAEPALYMVWPEVRRFGDFDRMSDSYRLAPEDVDGIPLPASGAWRAAWRRDLNAQFYSWDGLHPAVPGSYGDLWAAVLRIAAAVVPHASGALSSCRADRSWSSVVRAAAGGGPRGERDFR